MISEKLNVDLSQISAQLTALKQQSQQADQRAQAAAARVARTEGVLRKLETEASQVGVAIERAAKRLGRQVVRGAATYGTGLALSSLEMPEAVSPLVRTGSAAAAGAQVAGAPGAIAFASVQALQEAVGYIRRLQEEFVRMKNTVEGLLESQAKIQERLVEREREQERRFKDFVAATKDALKAEMRELDYQSFQLSKF